MPGAAARSRVLFFKQDFEDVIRHVLERNPTTIWEAANEVRSSDARVFVRHFKNAVAVEHLRVPPGGLAVLQVDQLFPASLRSARNASTSATVKLPLGFNWMTCCSPVMPVIIVCGMVPDMVGSSLVSAVPPGAVIIASPSGAGCRWRRASRRCSRCEPSGCSRRRPPGGRGRRRARALHSARKPGGRARCRPFPSFFSGRGGF